MKKEDFKKLQPDLYETSKGFTETHNESSNLLNEQSFNKGVYWILRYLEDKFSDFTENELLAIEEYKTNKLSAVKFLMSESNYGLKEAKDFLDKQTQ